MSASCCQFFTLRTSIQQGRVAHLGDERREDSPDDTVDHTDGPDHRVFLVRRGDKLRVCHELCARGGVGSDSHVPVVLRLSE